jgi:hypothetical protein
MEQDYALLPKASSVAVSFFLALILGEVISTVYISLKGGLAQSV